MEKDQFMYAFGRIANALGGGGDYGQCFPASDADDLGNGARYIPGEVTMARRRGEKVSFDPVKHQWTFDDGRVVG